MFLEIDEGSVISSHINQEIEVGSMIFVTSTTESWFGYKNMDGTIHNSPQNDSSFFIFKYYIGNKIVVIWDALNCANIRFAIK